MTRQEEISEGIKPFIEASSAGVCNKCGGKIPILVDQTVAYIWEYLHSKGVVIKVDKPSRIATSINNDGLVAVEPLI